jgi:aminoglycoside phosphotransferase (APT) family kinase protein
VPDEPSDGSYALLNRACRIARLNAESARLLRIGSNAVYRLCAPVVVRIARPDADVDGARRTVAVARWLESVGYPSVRAIDADQPIVIDGHAVTFWQAVSDDGDEYASVGEVAQVLVELHRLVAPNDLGLPPLEPFDKAAKRIEANDWLSSTDRGFLTETLIQMQESYGELDFVLPQGVIHGDANVGNVLHDLAGNPVVIDLDGFAIGPREWDLALTAIYYDSFGWHTREEYETFVRVYGFDIMKWPGYPVMRAVREFLMVPWVIQQAGESPRVAAEARKRISALRTGASRKDWKPY